MASQSKPAPPASGAAAARILCVLTSLLGNRGMAELLLRSLKQIRGLDVKLAIIGPDDYQDVPRWARLSYGLEAQYIARRKVRPLLRESFDLLLVNSWEYVIALRDMARRTPAVAMIDTVPSLVTAQPPRPGGGGWRRWPMRYIHHPAFRRAARQFRAFLPLASDCAAALQRDYGIAPERCQVTLVPQDLAVWTPARRTYQPPLRLLFVGNNFRRKGGEFLLRMFDEHLKGECVLTIASNDPFLRSRALPEGAVWIRAHGSDELLALYREADVLVLPTEQDALPRALGEALATGLPCLANDVGGIGDVVQSDRTGYLMSRDATAEEWAQKIRWLAGHPEQLERLSIQARQFAEAELDARRFEIRLEALIAQLRRSPAAEPAVTRA